MITAAKDGGRISTDGRGDGDSAVFDVRGSAKRKADSLPEGEDDPVFPCTCVQSMTDKVFEER